MQGGGGGVQAAAAAAWTVDPAPGQSPSCLGGIESCSLLRPFQQQVGEVKWDFFTSFQSTSQRITRGGEEETAARQSFYAHENRARSWSCRHRRGSGEKPPSSSVGFPPQLSSAPSLSRETPGKVVNKDAEEEEEETGTFLSYQISPNKETAAKKISYGQLLASRLMRLTCEMLRSCSRFTVNQVLLYRPEVYSREIRLLIFGRERRGNDCRERFYSTVLFW